MALKPFEKFNLIQDIALKLQAEYNTSGINSLLVQYGVETEPVNIVPSKKNYVEDLLKFQQDDVVIRLATDLNICLPRKEVLIQLDFSKLLERNELNSVIEDFNRAYASLQVDPELAIASASSTLESICKAICDFFNEEYPAAESMQPLISKTYRLLKLSPDQYANEQIKKILGGLLSVASGIGTLRTKNSSAHGHGTKKVKLSPRHARLVISSCATIGTFILETYYENCVLNQ